MVSSASSRLFLSRLLARLLGLPKRYRTRGTLAYRVVAFEDISSELPRVIQRPFLVTHSALDFESKRILVQLGVLNRGGIVPTCVGSAKLSV